MTEKNKERVFVFLTYIFCCLFSLLFAFINGFPLIYSDAGTYIVSGFTFELPFDRPIFYGLFIKFTSLGISLWITILGQALISTFLIRQILIYFFPLKKTNRHLLISIIVLSCMSSYALVVAETIADIFTAFLILAVIAWQNDEPGTGRKLLLLLIICFSQLAHTSHSMILPGGIIFLYLIQFIFKIGNRRKLNQLLFISLTTLLFNLWFNYYNGKGFRLSTISSTAIFARLIETGAVHEYVR